MRCFGDIDINNFTSDSLKEYLDLVLKSLFNWAHREGIIVKNSATKIKEPKLGKRIPKFLSEQEIELLRESCLTPMEKALFEKVIKLNREDINFHSQSVVVHGKGGKEREVYFNVWCDIWLKRYLDKEWKMIKRYL
jgi:integrase/recombinase XerD